MFGSYNKLDVSFAWQIKGRSIHTNPEKRDTT